MTIEFIEPTTLIRKHAIVRDLLSIKKLKEDIYFNGNLLPKNLDNSYKETLIDYAGLSLIKKLYLSSETETNKTGYENESNFFLHKYAYDYAVFLRLSAQFAWDLRELRDNEEFSELVLCNGLARQLIAMVEFTGARFDELGEKLIKNLDKFKKIIDIIEDKIK